MRTSVQPGGAAEAGAVTPAPQAEATKMRAVVQHRYGTADALEIASVPRPTPGPDQVLIEVAAAGVDRGVWHLMTGQPYLIRLMGYGFRAPSRAVPGADVSGRVVAVGDRVRRFHVGDEVFGIAEGSFAQFAVADADKLSLKPAMLSHEQAAVAPVSGSTALQAVEDIARVEAGQRVLVIGASGGVGTFAVQLAVARGAVVTGVASGEKAALVRSLGAQHVIDYHTEDLASEGVAYDVVIDIGGRNSLRRLRGVMARRGMLVIVGGEGGGRFTGGIGRQLRAVLLSPFVPQRLTMFISTEHHSFTDRLAAHLEGGSVTPAVGHTVTLEQVPDAIRALEAGQVRGKIAVRIGGAA